MRLPRSDGLNGARRCLGSQLPNVQYLFPSQLWNWQIFGTMISCFTDTLICRCSAYSSGNYAPGKRWIYGGFICHRRRQCSVNVHRILIAIVLIKFTIRVIIPYRRLAVT